MTNFLASSGLFMKGRPGKERQPSDGNGGEETLGEKLDQIEQSWRNLVQDAGVDTTRDIDRPGQQFIEVEENS